MKLPINGRNLYIEETGPENGPVVVLLHHGLGSVRAWRAQESGLAEAGFRVMAYDRWGYGDSDMRTELDIPTFNTDIMDLSYLLELLNISKAALVGHSDGGTIALYFAAQRPEVVSCLVTVAAHIYVEATMEPSIQDIRQAFEIDERFRTGMKYAHGDKFELVFHNWFDGWHRQELLNWDIRPVLGQINCPTLVVQGEDDEHASPQHARDIASSIPNADLWLLPSARHMLPQENAEEFNTRVIRFLNVHVKQPLQLSMD